MGPSAISREGTGGTYSKKKKFSERKREDSSTYRVPPQAIARDDLSTLENRSKIGERRPGYPLLERRRLTPSLRWVGIRSRTEARRRYVLIKMSTINGKRAGGDQTRFERGSSEENTPITWDLRHGGCKRQTRGLAQKHMDLRLAKHAQR